MRFRTKIFAVLLLTGLLPVLLMGWASYRLSRNELVYTIGSLQTQNAQELAFFCQDFLTETATDLRLAATYIPAAELSPQELTTVLSIPYRQLSYVNILVALDTQGQALSSPVYSGDPNAQLELERRQLVDTQSLARFSDNIPLAEALQHGTAMGPVYHSHDTPRVTIVARAGEATPWLLVAEVSLQKIAGRLQQYTGGSSAYLVGGAGQLLAHSQAKKALSPAEKTFITAGLDRQERQTESLELDSGQAVLATIVPVQTLGWAVVVTQDQESAFRGPRRLGWFTLFWAAVALLLTAGLGMMLSRNLDRPIRALSAGAKALTDGNYQQRVEIDSTDEIGEFAQAFNHMAQEIERREQDIRNWNRDLQRRVDLRTAELKQAQEQILRARRLSALSSLSAGVSHEFNNPLTGLIGLIEIVKKDLAGTSQAQLLNLALEQGQRIVNIVKRLNQFADQERDHTRKHVRLAQLVRSSLELFQEEFTRRNIELVTDFADTSIADATTDGSPEHLQQLVGHLLQNAIDAMPDGGKLQVAVNKIGNSAIKLRIEDTGCGIEEGLMERIFDPFFSTKTSSAQVGMGLSICHRIVEAHHGKMVLNSTRGQGTSVEIFFSAAAEEAHLV